MKLGGPLSLLEEMRSGLSVALIYSASPLTPANRHNRKLAVVLGQESVLARGQAPEAVLRPACGYAGWPGASGRPGSGGEAQRGGVGTESGGPRCDGDVRRQPPDTIKHRPFAEFANKPAGRGTEAAARKQM